MQKRVLARPRIRGIVNPPGDKSISHRALILSGIAAGKARISNFLPSDDCVRTAECMRALGVAVMPVPGDLTTVEVVGAGANGLHEPGNVLDAGNSGTSLRLMAGLLAAQPFLTLITGDASLRSRPMARVIEPLTLMGASIWGRKGNTLAPLAIKGSRLHGIDYSLPVASAQVKSAILIASLFADGQTLLREPAQSRDHTERLLKWMGARLSEDNGGIRLEPTGKPLLARDIVVPGDISSAAYWMVLGAIHPDASIEIKGIGVNPTRSGILEALRKMGATIRIGNRRTSEGNEPVADITVESSEITGVEIGGELVPRLIDEIPALAVAACFARGTTVIRDAGELRVKETDRIKYLVQELRKFGAHLEETADGMVIEGAAGLSGTHCHSYEDHRLAMALAVAGLMAEGETLIESAEAVNVSYPAFWQDLERVAAS